MYGVEKRFKMQLLLGLKGSPLVGVRIVNFVPPEAPPAGEREFESRSPVQREPASPLFAGVVLGCWIPISQ